MTVFELWRRHIGGGCEWSVYGWTDGSWQQTTEMFHIFWVYPNYDSGGPHRISPDSSDTLWHACRTGRYHDNVFSCLMCTLSVRQYDIVTTCVLKMPLNPNKPLLDSRVGLMLLVLIIVFGNYQRSVFRQHLLYHCVIRDV